jgi:EAL domain-containing protein (putative c-di-GMP-specific phosphodiesterase class I)/ActR/RegA family two-component response regulator
VSSYDAAAPAVGLVYGMNMIPHLDSISPSILVVDDDRIQRDIIGRIAAGAGCTVATASSFDSAAEQLALRPFDLVTVDLSLGDRDGIELLRLLATLSVKPRVIVVSGCEERILNATIRMARSVGILDVVGFQKPLSPARFREVLAARSQITPREARCERSAITPSDLRDGLNRLEIFPVFQPKVALATARVVGCESLARWTSSVLGDVPASEFIALAEQHGQIGALTTTILEQSIEAARGLLRTDPDSTMAVNISAELLSDLNFPETIERMLRRSDVPPRSLVLEITESIAMSDVNRATDILVRLRLKGIGISIDDFGTGYSSLRALAGMPFTELKIDQSFVNGGLSDPDLWKVVRASVALAHEMAMTVVAEGIEDLKTWHALRAIGCDAGQGFYFSRPLTIEKFAAWSRDWTSRHEPAAPLSLAQ